MSKFDIPEPAKIAPQLTREQQQAMAPIDLLVQYIMPKLWDKVNYLEWAMKGEVHSIRESIEELKARVDKLEALASKPKKSRSRKANEPAQTPAADSDPRPSGVEVNVSEPVQLARVANYDPDTDNWVPKVIDGTEITASVIEMLAANAAAFPMTVAAFIYDLSENERKVLCDMFPSE